jgi:uncharacterized protein YdhG (YjbR/CyaY superfamily)
MNSNIFITPLRAQQGGYLQYAEAVFNRINPTSDPLSAYDTESNIFHDAYEPKFFIGPQPSPNDIELPPQADRDGIIRSITYTGKAALEAIAYTVGAILTFPVWYFSSDKNDFGRKDRLENIFHLQVYLARRNGQECRGRIRSIWNQKSGNSLVQTSLFHQDMHKTTLRAVWANLNHKDTSYDKGSDSINYRQYAENILYHNPTLWDKFNKEQIIRSSIATDLYHIIPDDLVLERAKIILKKAGFSDLTEKAIQLHLTTLQSDQIKTASRALKRLFENRQDATLFELKENSLFRCALLIWEKTFVVRTHDNKMASKTESTYPVLRSDVVNRFTENDWNYLEKNHNKMFYQTDRGQTEDRNDKITAMISELEDKSVNYLQYFGLATNHFKKLEERLASTSPAK